MNEDERQLMLKINREWFIVCILSVVASAVVGVWFGSTLTP